MPAARPHQKTRLHLRDSASVDFGPAGFSVTNSGVTVANEEFTFDGASFIGGGSLFAAENPDDWSVVVWFKFAPGTSRNTIYHDTSNNRTVARGIFLFQESNGTIQLQYNSATSGSWSALTTSGNYQDGQWHQLVISKSGTSLVMRVDYDAEVWSATVTASYDWMGCEKIGFGKDDRTGGGLWADGQMADLRVLAYGLTQGEAFTLWNEGRGYDLPERRQLSGTQLLCWTD